MGLLPELGIGSSGTGEGVDPLKGTVEGVENPGEPRVLLAIVLVSVDHEITDRQRDRREERSRCRFGLA